MENSKAPLRNETLTNTELSARVVALGSKMYASDGLAFDNEGILYMTALEASGINIARPLYALDTNEMFIASLVSESKTMVWPDTIGFNNNKNQILFVTNQLYKYVEETLNFSEANYRIWVVDANTNSYLQPASALSKQIYPIVITGYVVVCNLYFLIFVVIIWLTTRHRQNVAPYDPIL